MRVDRKDIYRQSGGYIWGKALVNIGISDVVICRLDSWLHENGNERYREESVGFGNPVIGICASWMNISERAHSSEDFAELRSGLW